MDIFGGLPALFPGVRFERNFSFPRHTTIGCGGEAAVCALPGCAEDCAALLRFLGGKKIPYCLLGAGANVLPSDGFFDGVVVRFSRMNAISAAGEEIFCGAGVTGGALCRFARERSLSGFEPFTGIPMSVGGGVTMNAGVAEGHFSDVTVRVFAVEGGEIRSFSRAECGFSEKTSVFQTGIAVVGAVFRGARRARAEIDERTERFRARRARLPKGRSMGCVFVNPEGESAGRLVDLCGLKGARIGGAVVSEEHGNFILNEGGAAEDVARLIAFVKAEVARKTGVLLREEIRRIP